MNEPIKTLAFVISAVALAALAVMSHFFNQPTNSSDFELVGKPFFEDFTSSSQAQSLHVAAVDPLTGEPRRFVVEKKNGLWIIPSHYDYPAEAADRLAKTASSVIGIERESLEGRLVSEHERLGVVDPLSDDLDDPETAGKRITFKSANGEPIVDLIIGKKADDVAAVDTPGAPGFLDGPTYYYVRCPDEKQTYKVALELDLSTKFSDWIDPDLLQIARNDLRRIHINNFVLKEGGTNVLGQAIPLVKVQDDELVLTRDSAQTPWELAGLDSETETLQLPRANEILGVLDEMTIAGVRPKFRFKGQLLLTPDLRVFDRPEFREDPQGFGIAQRRLQLDLQQKGFNFAGTNKQLELVAQHGEIQAGTDKGVVYTLHIGKPIEGDEHEIEIGSAGNSGDEPNDTAVSESESSTEPSDSDSDITTPAEATTVESKNRYLMIRVSLDESLIDGQPVEPVKPTAPVAPEGYTPPVENEADQDDAANPNSGDDAAPVPNQETERDAGFIMHDKALDVFDQLQIEYELALTKFEDDKKEFASKLQEGQELVDVLNERFGAWYYVISADKLSALQSKRTDLVSPKDLPKDLPKAAPKAPITLQPRPDISFPEFPADVER